MILGWLKAILVRLPAIVSLLLLFLRELAMSAIRVAVLVLRPDMMKAIRPALIAYPLSSQSDASITMLANLITLTPGTLSVDVSEDRSTLFIHAIDMGDREALIKDIATGFETRVKAVFQ
jgi:multicomponent Na+:H+ antiporter subunit E